MPALYHQIIDHTGALGVWRVTESEAWFKSHLHLYDQERGEFEPLKGHRRLEWLATRFLLHTLLQEADRAPCLKDKYGKPHLKGLPWHISFSHSHDLVAAIFSPISVGIDIQFVVPRITSLAHKFVSTQEAQMVRHAQDVHYLHVVWGAKECLYKAYGRRQLDFRQNLYLEWDGQVEHQGSLTGILHAGRINDRYNIHYQWFTDWVLVYAQAQENAYAPKSNK